MDVDYAQIAYESWAGGIADDDEPLEAWDAIKEESTRPWVAVGLLYEELCSSDPDKGPESYPFELAYPVLGPVLNDGTLASSRGLPTPASSFTIRRPLAADAFALEQYDEEEREFRLVAACMTKTETRSRFNFQLFGKFDFEDVLEIRRHVLCGWESLEGALYGAWRESALLVEALILVQDLHPEDAECFLRMETMGPEPRDEVVSALRSRSELGDVGEERWEGKIAWPGAADIPDWETLRLQGSPLRWIWHSVALSLATSGEVDSIQLFSPGVTRRLTPLARLRVKDVVALRRGDSEEEKMINLAATLCGVEVADLHRLVLDDYERLVRTAQEWLGKRQREKTRSRTPLRGSKGSTKPSASSAGASVSSSPSP